MRTEKKHPTKNWPLIWKNIYHTPITDQQRATWYKTVHDIVATNEHLHAIKMSETNTSRKCGENDDIPHRIGKCRDGELSWSWKEKKIGDNPPNNTKKRSHRMDGISRLCNIPEHETQSCTLDPGATGVLQHDQCDR
jgi:hypothetical protein